MNWLCGKLAERYKGTLTKLISDRHELCRFLATPEVEVVNMLFATDSFVWASLRYIAEEKVPSLRHTNQEIAAFVACGGRMHFYAHLYKLRERAVYCETDSVIFVQDGEPPLV